MSQYLKLIGIALIAMSISGGVYAEGDPEKGKKVFKKCSACHSVVKDEHITGPSLYKVLGKKAGQVDGYSYSKAFKEADITWTDDNLKAFVQNPRKFLPKNKMIFGGLRKEKDRDNLLAYLKSIQE